MVMNSHEREVKKMVSNRIASWRRYCGLSQKEMAKILQIGETTYRMKELGYSEFRHSEIKDFTNEVKKYDATVNEQIIFF